MFPHYSLVLSAHPLSSLSHLVRSFLQHRRSCCNTGDLLSPSPIRNDAFTIISKSQLTQLEMSHVREEIANDLRELRRSLTGDLDALNHEVDDVRAGQLDLANMVVDFKKHLCSLQASYVNIVLGETSGRK
ncbi:unnamed protein product [Lactuca virosa]|uniref:t-SNARE coiled-coil homology domain-containing protein n=1 Tax=Lactuca virosa TaxID=75947 RepID=A0AAU9PCD9_9ASTR|nr:unnamed protein product [Lactuca virosa]